jgi:hypothetical protein
MIHKEEAVPKMQARGGRALSENGASARPTLMDDQGRADMDWTALEENLDRLL